MGIDEIRLCDEVDGPDATCYKPKPGMLLDSAKHNDLDLGRGYMVGDRWRDVVRTWRRDASRSSSTTAIANDAPTIPIASSVRWPKSLI
ncbi:MAG: HAD hydrolase-like protein [Rhodospirillales bacterium]